MNEPEPTIWRVIFGGVMPDWRDFDDPAEAEAFARRQAYDTEGEVAIIDLPREETA